MTATPPGPSPEPPDPSFDAFADDYDAALDRGISLSGESKDFFAAGRVKWLDRQLQRRSFRPGRVLDFGCGTGSATPYLLGLPGVEAVVGIDVSGKSIDTATRQFGGENTRFTTVADFSEEGTFDLAFCNGVFHHIPLAERAEAVRVVFRALRPGGWFAFWENNPWNPGTKLVMSRIPFDRDAITLSILSAKRLLRAGGFVDPDGSFQFVFPGPLRALRFLEPALSGLPIGAQYQVLARKPAGAGGGR